MGEGERYRNTQHLSLIHISICKNEELKGVILNNVEQQQREQGEAVNALKQKIVEVDNRQRSTEQKIDATDKEQETRIEEIRGHITKVKEGQERLQRQLANAEVGTTARVGGLNNSELKYNDTDRYPMEFLKELSEIQNMFYRSDDVKWIGRHLEADAAIWWRVIRDQINNFEEFKDIFTQKYWGEEKQDAIRDSLEYGRYN